MKSKQLYVGGSICLREGLLEMFACPRGTKEHESIVAVNTPARFVHGGLLALGAQPGLRYSYNRNTSLLRAREVKVEVVWKDAQVAGNTCAGTAVGEADKDRTSR